MRITITKVYPLTWISKIEGSADDVPPNIVNRPQESKEKRITRVSNGKETTIDDESKSSRLENILGYDDKATIKEEDHRVLCPIRIVKNRNFHQTLRNLVTKEKELLAPFQA
jgi:hypothetical protein